MKPVIFTFGRFQPPTNGHELLIKRVREVAYKQKGEPRIYLSHTWDRKKNPLKYRVKLEFTQAAFGKIIKRSGRKTIIDILKSIAAEGVETITMIVGSDRVDEFRRLLNFRNGKDYKFKDIFVLSAGQRDPDDDNVAGVSGTKIRAAAVSGDWETFIKGMPSGLSLGKRKKLFNHIREILEEFEELPIDESIWNIPNEILDDMVNNMEWDDEELIEACPKNLKKIDKILNKKKKLKERVLSNSEKETKEKYVKSMKKKGGFDRYGDDAKSVMYATATKMAKEETNLANLLRALAEIEDNGLEHSLDEILNMQQRIAKARLMKRLAPRMARMRKLMAKRIAPMKKLQARANKAALKIIRTRVAGKMGANYANLSISQKMAVDKLTAKHKKKVGALAKKLLPKIKKAETERIKKLRSSKNEDKEVKFSKCLHPISEDPATDYLFPGLKGKLKHIGHNKDFEHALRQYGKERQNPKNKQMSNVALARKVANMYRYIEVKEFIKFINSHVKSKRLPQRIAAEYNPLERIYNEN